MGAQLTQQSSLARSYFDQASQILGYDLLRLCVDGPIEQLSRTEFCQPALFVHSYAALKQLESQRPELWDSVASVAGLSLGEYTAVAAASGMSFEDGVRLVQIRGRAMQRASEAVPSGMASVLGLEQQPLEEICRQASTAGEFVRVANLLCPGNIAISGHLGALDTAEQLCAAAGAMKTVRLQVAGAFHTAIMQPAAVELAAALADVEFRSPRVPIYSNVDASPHLSPDEVKQLLSAQLVSPVLWELSLQNMIQSGVNQFLEVGAGRVLAGTLKRIHRKMPCENVGD